VVAAPVTDPGDLVDRGSLIRFLSGVLPPFDDVNVSVLVGGASNLTYLVEVDERPLVVRRRPMGASAPRAHDMRREFLALEGLAGVRFPVPRPIAFSDDKSVVGEPFYLMEFVAGTALHTVDEVVGLSSDVARECSTQLVDTLAQLHSVNPKDIGLGSFGRPDGFVERRINSWTRQWRSVKHRALPAVEVLGERLLSRLPDAGDGSLIHGDYRLGNVLFMFEPVTKLTAVLDWEMSTLGDPLTDLAHLLVYWEPTTGRVTHPSQLISRCSGFLDGAAIVDRYASATGRDVSALPFYLAFEHWRAAIIKDAIYLRAVARDGDGISEEFVSLGESVQRHLEEAADVLAGVGPAVTVS
jgi:aminoglycoside phosphotransferase (APT) family kinase protein